MKKTLSILAVLAALLALVFLSGDAAAGARQGLAVCGAALIPSLFPFFVLANLLSALGLPDLLGQRLGGTMRRLFCVSGFGAQAFLLGLSGGYPLGASVVADLRRDGRISRDEAERLLAFCNNSGPAFILGAAGGVFHSAAAGALLYGTHVLAAVCVGLLFRSKQTGSGSTECADSRPAVCFSAAFSSSVSKAAASVIAICGYVILFSAFLSLIPLPASTPPVWKSLFTGIFELGGGIASLNGLSPTPQSLSAAAFILGWGGVSVHCQTLGVLAETDIKRARHLLGRALCGLLAAGFTFCFALVLFPG